MLKEHMPEFSQPVELKKINCFEQRLQRIYCIFREKKKILQTSTLVSDHCSVRGAKAQTLPEHLKTEGTSGAHLVEPPCSGQGQPEQGAPQRHPTAPLGNLLQGLAAPTVRFGGFF